MKRSLTLLVFLGCASAESETKTTADSHTVWLETWREARRCLVADAEDVRTGVAISMLNGRDCTKHLHHLEARISLDDDMRPSEMPGVLRAIADHPASPSKRAKAIEAMDAIVAARAGATAPITIPSRSLRTLRAAAPLFDGKPVNTARFNGGFVSGIAAKRRFVVDAIDDERVVAVDANDTLAIPSRTWRVGWRERPIAAADAGARRLVLRRTRGSAYALDISDGARWTTHAAPRGTSLLDAWQDPRTGGIQVLIRDAEDRLFFQRISPTEPRSRMLHAAHAMPRARQDRECDNAGVRWTLDGDRVARFGEAPLTLGGSARHGQLDCRGDVALVLRRSPDVIERCHHHCWPVFTSAVHGSIASLDDGRWIYAAILEDVVAIWLEPKGPFAPRPEPMMFRLPKLGALVAIAVVAGRPALVMLDGETYQLVPLK